MNSREGFPVQNTQPVGRRKYTICQPVGRFQYEIFSQLGGSSTKYVASGEGLQLETCCRKEKVTLRNIQAVGIYSSTKYLVSKDIPVRNI